MSTKGTSGTCGELVLRFSTKQRAILTKRNKLTIPPKHNTYIIIYISFKTKNLQTTANNPIKGVIKD